MKSIPAVVVLQVVVGLLQVVVCVWLYLTFAELDQIRHEPTSRDLIRLRDGDGNGLELTPRGIEMRAHGLPVFGVSNLDGLPVISLYDAAGKLRCQLQGREPGGSLKLVGSKASQVVLGTGGGAAQARLFNGGSGLGAHCVLTVTESSVDVTVRYGEAIEGLNAKSKLVDGPLVRSKLTIALEDGTKRTIQNR